MLMVFIFLRTEERLPVWKPANLVKLQGYAMVQKAAKGVDDERKRNDLIVGGGTEGPGGEPAPAPATVLSSSRFQQAAPPAELASARKRAAPKASVPKASSVGHSDGKRSRKCADAGVKRGADAGGVPGSKVQLSIDKCADFEQLDVMESLNGKLLGRERKGVHLGGQPKSFCPPPIFDP